MNPARLFRVCWEACRNTSLIGATSLEDRLVGTLAEAFPDAILAVFAMHGMGSNESDLPAFALLPELLYRHAFPEPVMQRVEWPVTPPMALHF